MIVPTLSEFEETLYNISVEANDAIEPIYNAAAAKDLVYENGHMKDISSVGSSVMHLDGRKPLYKFLKSIPYDPEKFYFIHADKGKVSIILRNVFHGQSYKLRKAAYDVIVEKLRLKYGWEIYNDVRVD